MTPSCARESRAPRPGGAAPGRGRRSTARPRPKALLPHRGRTLVEHVAEAMLLGGCADVTVVCGAGAPDVAAALATRAGARCVENPRWPAGMGTSLRSGLEAIGPGVDVLVMPVDRPGTGAPEIERVIGAHRPGGFTAAAHRDRDGRLQRGHPVLLDARWTGEAAAAAHDYVGARDVLTARRDLLRVVDCSDLDDGADIDEPHDLARLRP